MLLFVHNLHMQHTEEASEIYLDLWCLHKAHLPHIWRENMTPDLILVYSCKVVLPRSLWAFFPDADVHEMFMFS